MAYTLVPTELIQDGAVTSAKLDTNIAISGTLSVGGVTTLATHLVMGDNDKIKIGTGGDLEIYHDASNSYIANSTGNLYIGDTNGSVHIQAKLNEDSIVAAADGAVTLYYDNAAKLATSSAGVTVTGALTSGAITSSGAIQGTSYKVGSTTVIDSSRNLINMGNVNGAGGAFGVLTVDNFTLNGTTLALSSGDMTLDVAGDIILDSANGYVKLLDGGTEYGRIYESSNRLVIQSMVSNGDLLFSGVDGGTGFTALTLDMSEAGAATFNAGVTATGLSITSNTPVINIIESDQSNKQYQIGSFGSAYAINDASASQFRYILDTNGNHIFNEGGVDADFRVESDGSAYAFLVEGSDGGGTPSIGFGTADPTKLHFGGNGALLHLNGDDSQIRMANHVIHSDNSGLTHFHIRNHYGATNAGAELSLEGGYISLNAGTSFSETARVTSHGITFGGDTADANALDDYEEGTYNATISCASGSITLYSSYTALRYTKIGRQVHIQGKLAMSAVSSPSGATNLNLPFASANDTNRSGVANNIMTGFFNGSAVTDGIYPIYGDIAEASSNCRLFIMQPPATNNLGDNHVAAGSDIHVNFTYTTA